MEVIPTVLTVIAAVVAIYVVIALVRYIFFGYTASLTGLEKGSVPVQITADRMAAGSNTGNYTYSVWIYVQDWNYRFGQKKNVFERKGSAGNQSPLRVYLGENTNNIIVETLCYSPDGPSALGGSAKFECAVDNFPLQAWVNLTISQYGRTLDMYIDGKLVRTCVAPGAAKPGKGDVELTGGGGFHGHTCKFRYFDEASNPQQAYNIYKSGPCPGAGSFGYKLKVSLWKADQQKWHISL